MFAAFALPKSVLGNQLGLTGPVARKLWLVLAGVTAPLGVLVVFLVTIIGLENVKAWFAG